MEKGKIGRNNRFLFLNIPDQLSSISVLLTILVFLVIYYIHTFSFLHSHTHTYTQCEGIPGGPGGGQKPKLFGYNVVFEPGATQSDVLEYSGIKRIIEMAIEGFSCTAFCYGQTGSGKTHTLTGPPDLVIISLDPKLYELYKYRVSHRSYLPEANLYPSPTPLMDNFISRNE